MHVRQWQTRETRFAAIATAERPAFPRPVDREGGVNRVETIADGVTLYLGDCREILPTLGKVDAVVTDPPYGIAYSQGINRKSRTSGLANNKVPPRHSPGEVIVGDSEPFDPVPLLKFERCVIWGGNHFAEKLPAASWLVWDKRCGVYPELHQSDAEIAWCSVGQSIRVFRWLWTGLVRQKVEKASGGANAQRYHPFEKPVELMEWCIKRFKDSPQTILDPFMGSGTTGVAAVKLGRKFIGIEIEPKYFDIACRRIEEVTRQPDLFIERPAPPVQASFDYDAAKDMEGSINECYRAIRERMAAGGPGFDPERKP